MKSLCRQAIQATDRASANMITLILWSLKNRTEIKAPGEVGDQYRAILEDLKFADQQRGEVE